MNTADTTSKKKWGIRKKVIFCVIIVIILLLVAGFIGYFVGENYYGSHFLKGTTVNGIDVSDMTVEELEQRIQQYTLTVETKDSQGQKRQEKITGSQIGLKVVSDGDLQNVLDGQQSGKWISGSGKEYSVSNLTEYDEELWKKAIDGLECFSEEHIVKPQNAYVKEYDQNSKSFPIVEEVNGNEIDREKAEQLMTAAVVKLEENVSFGEDYYKKPEITTETESLKAFHEKLNQYANTNIKYTFGENIEELTGEDICNWLIIDFENYQVSLDAERVDKYVSYLRWNYDTIFGTRKFKTSYGTEVTIEGGDYGWWMNKAEEVAGLTAQIEAGQSGERKPVYYQEAAAYGDLDYGNTYVEINLTAQHLFLYVDGQKVMESDFTSGLPGEHLTPPGTFAVTYTQKYAYLTGENYRTPVTYWMPFNEDIGMHDATWKTQFGSQFYKSAGSHGCINLPYNFAKSLFSYVEKGMPVICYNLSGTESTSVTIQSEEEKAQSVIDAINEIATSSRPAKPAEYARALYDHLGSAAKAKVTNYSDLLAYERRNQ